MIRVMIVEDDPMVASVNETYLSRLPGFCVIAKAADGLQALEKDQKRFPASIWCSLTSSCRKWTDSLFSNT